MFRIISLLLFIYCIQSSYALENIADDIFVEQRAKKLFSQIRCVVCQGGSIKDSNADVAIAMREVIREKIKSGNTDDQVKDYIRNIYGQYALYEPIFVDNWFLWLLPTVLIFLAISYIIYSLRGVLLKKLR